jgi:hypothetical protein
MSPLVPIIGGLLVLVVIAANDWRRNRPRCYFCGARRHWFGVCSGTTP